MPFFVPEILAKKWFHPDSNWGPENQNLICCPYTMEPSYSFLFFPLPFLFDDSLEKKGTIGFEPMTTGTAVLCSTTELCALLFLDLDYPALALLFLPFPILYSE